MLKHYTMTTPAGALSMVVSPAGAVRAAGFEVGEIEQLVGLIHPLLREKVEPVDDVGPISERVRAYFDGDLTAIDEVPVEQHSSGEFTRHAWQVMRGIKAGEPVTYTEFAAMSGRPAAVRGAASACASNPVAFFTPCHRVLRIGGALGGYRWGLPVKRWLLGFEART